MQRYKKNCKSGDYLPKAKTIFTPNQSLVAAPTRRSQPPAIRPQTLMRPKAKALIYANKNA